MSQNLPVVESPGAVSQPAPDSRRDPLDREPLTIARLCAQLLDTKKMQDISILDVRNTLQISDYFVIASGLNSRQLQAACDLVDKSARERGLTRLGLEGYREGKWVLLDFGEVVIHLFQGDRRRFYDLELLWGDSPKVDWKALSPAG